MKQVLMGLILGVALRGAPITVIGSGTFMTDAADSVFEAYGGFGGTSDGGSFWMSGVMDWMGAGIAPNHHGQGGCMIDGMMFAWPRCNGSFSGTGGTFTGYSADYQTILATETLEGEFSYTRDCNHGYCTGTWQITQTAQLHSAPEPATWVTAGAALLLTLKRRKRDGQS